MRKYGAWTWGGDGVALHLGDQVLINGEPRRAGFREQAALWVRLAPQPRPAEPAPAKLGAEFERLLGGWNWANTNSPAVLLGLTVAGTLAGLLPWRPHGIVVGEFGSGKSTLLAMLPKFCPLLRYKNDYTEPGLRRMLSDTAAALILDEAESDAIGDGRLTRVIEMLRRASSGKGLAQVQGGGDGGRARFFTIMANAILGCTLPPTLTPQDASRFTLLVMKKLDSVGGDVALDAFLTEHGLALWGRALAEAPRMLRLFRALRAHLIGCGSDPREADQLGMIAACRWVMVCEASRDPRHDEPDELDVPIECIRHLITTTDDKATASAGALAFQHLAMMAADQVGERVTIGKTLERLREAQAELLRARGNEPATLVWAQEQRKTIAKLSGVLQQMGVKWGTWPAKATADTPDPPWGLYVVAQSHPRLSRGFDGTPWAGGRWSAALAQLPDVLSGRMGKMVRIDGVLLRCLWIATPTIDALTRELDGG